MQSSANNIFVAREFNKIKKKDFKLFKIDN